MRLSRRRPKPTTQLNMTPMIDIVFLLIIFFMTVSQVSEVNRQPLELPKLAGSVDQEPAAMTVNVRENGQLVVYGREASLDEFTVLVGDRLAELEGQAERLSVIVRGDARGSSRGVNDVVRKLTEQGIARVRLAVEVPN